MKDKYLTTRYTKSDIGYERNGILVRNIGLENKITFYAKYGDYIARIALLMFILTTLFLFKNFLIKK